MARNSIRSIVVTLLIIFAMIFAPIMVSDAIRPTVSAGQADYNHRGTTIKSELIARQIFALITATEEPEYYWFSNKRLIPRFISIDCGLPHGSSYEEKKTGLKYISDETFIDTGISRSIQPEYEEKYVRPAWSLRSFPEGNRNCYKIGVTAGTKYLIRAGFVYANYDGQDRPPAFDLYLGTDLWISVKFGNYLLGDDLHSEIIHVPKQNHVHVCLAKTGDSIPFITTLELRPLDNASYPVLDMGSLLKLLRLDAGSGTTYRYGDDSYDRLWNSFQPDDSTTLNTSLSGFNLNNTFFHPPPVVMTTASTPKNGDSLDFNFVLEADYSIASQCYVYMHFTEIEKLQANQSRQLQVFHNGKLFYGPFSPLSAVTTTIYNRKSSLIGRVHNFSISKTENSTLPPIINALEFYVVQEFLQAETDQQDSDSMVILKSAYGIKRNWQGDPCLPKIYSWEGVDCSYDDDGQLQAPRLISLNLSASGLVGDIPSSISNLTMIQTLNLENNNLRGPIPADLAQKWKDGFLSLSVCGNPKLSSTVSCKRKKKKNVVLPVTASVVGAFILVLIVVATWWVFLTKKRQDAKSTSQDRSLGARKQKFKYSEMVNITNNFERVLGEGGFGKVYYGCINNTQVAVKTLSVSSVQGYHQFQAEACLITLIYNVNLLMRVHHKNLTSLVGYCNDNDKNKLALIYEYMANGNLQQHFSGRNSNILKWEDRLLIATDAAQGLEYLHYGCKPPIIHRDVKTSNILLNENLRAKLSDFGLSRIIQNCNETHVSTVVAGTPGYLDPEYYMSNRLNEKSDVYSFGVVLLEITTGRPAISKSSDNAHVIQWVKQMLQNGNIQSIVDPRLEGNFNVNSAWKIVETAMNCVSQYSAERPTMSQAKDPNYTLI
ncbi:putative LRR receptor-like serine/threonine-protein kinase [Morus notabilis]|uniref:non-specific serine/threonine protein kinase n=1 Tax=Morus notabilis TaxID=981085 RepID=W9RH31_9ROSA|nr:putative LRR receptor-like serine/threonine-protein kinase [Morus notabilis]